MLTGERSPMIDEQQVRAGAFVIVSFLFPDLTDRQSETRNRQSETCNQSLDALYASRSLPNARLPAPASKASRAVARASPNVVTTPLT